MNLVNKCIVGQTIKYYIEFLWKPAITKQIGWILLQKTLLVVNRIRMYLVQTGSGCHDFLSVLSKIVFTVLLIHQLIWHNQDYMYVTIFNELKIEDDYKIQTKWES